jgi:TonB family protein
LSPFYDDVAVRNLARSVPVLLLLAGATGSALAGQVPVAGVVRDVTGTPVASVDVRVEGTAFATLTDDKGTFSLRGVSPGSHRLIVRRLGFRPAAMDVQVEAGHTAQIEIQIDPNPQQLTPITVAARPEAFDARLEGFLERSQSKAGHFIRRDRLQRLTSHKFSEILREVPGVKLGVVGRGASPQRTVRLRGANCPPYVFIDGFPAAAGEFDIDDIEPSTIEGVEIYHGLATIPAQFLGARGERCGVIAFWSRPYRPARPRSRGKTTSIHEILAANAAYTADKVDITATLKQGAPQVVYPDSLWGSGVSGRVLAEFVVDTLGRIEHETVGIVSSSHPAFSRAVLDALVSTSFKPALRNGRPVRQIVQLPFVFEPIRSARQD